MVEEEEDKPSSFVEEARKQVVMEAGDDSDRDVLGQQVHTWHMLAAMASLSDREVVEQTLGELEAKEHSLGASVDLESSILVE